LQRVNKLYVIGIGYKPLDNKARELLFASECVLASKRLFEVFAGYKEFKAVKDKVKVINSIEETIGFIRSALQGPQPSRITLLASGDPLFSGIGRRAINEFGKDTVEIFPELSSIQVAFSRIKEPWDDAFLISLHGGPDPAKRRRLPYTIGEIPWLLQKHGTLAILTDRENNPPAIAGQLQAALADQASVKMYVCERLGYDNEKITAGTPDEIAGAVFGEPNIVIVKGPAHERKSSSPVFGLKENEILHARGLITKDEVRAVTLHALRLPPSGVLWDIGAGSGSVSIEAARLCSGLKVFAVERSDELIALIRQNKIRLDAPGVHVIQGSAPEALQGLPAPDRVFIGGSGGNMEEIIRLVSGTMPSGIIVINATTLESLESAVKNLEAAGFNVTLSQVSVARSRILDGKRHMSSLNPVFIIKGERAKA